MRVLICVLFLAGAAARAASPPAGGGSGLPHNAAVHVHAPMAKQIMDVHVNVPQEKCEKAKMGKPPAGDNVCDGKKPTSVAYFDNVDCMKDGVAQALEQSGANVTVGYRGKIDATSRNPILTQYFEAGLCPVNVHWHLGAEHLSEGEYDMQGSGPHGGGGGHRRRADGPVRLGLQCHKYDAHDKKFTTPYKWKYCVGMEVGQTYEVHWPHSAAGACATVNQFQSPFYDGVFCMDGILSLDPLNTYFKIGVQGQVFVIVNDEKYYYPDLIRGAIVDGEHWKHVTKYTGSTTGTSRSNKVCSKYTPITWQVDRKCHLVSASSFDKMCQDMSMQRDDMSMDLHAHGAREVVLDEFASNNQHNRRRELTDQARKDEEGWELERVNFHF
jgi:hypothetical protein